MKERLEKLRPEVVINTAAYNLVEKCEQERDLSWAVNATGPETLAKICAEKNIRLIHYGTDYVFDGEKGSPYMESGRAESVESLRRGQARGRTGGAGGVAETSW